MSESTGAGSKGSSDAAEAYVPMRMGRLVLRDRSDQQWIQLVEVEGRRSFPIVIGPHEARELHRVLTGKETPRPLTHQLALAGLEAMGGALEAVRITDLRDNTFYAELRVRRNSGEVEALDARRAFPCWDEPARKASFVLTLTVPSGIEALSNMPEAEHLVLSSGQNKGHLYDKVQR